MCVWRELRETESVEADECAREVLTSRFQGIDQPTHASSVAELPEETDTHTHTHTHTVWYT